MALRDLGPRIYHDAINDGRPLLALLLLVGGFALAVITAIRWPRTHP